MPSSPHKNELNHLQRRELKARKAVRRKVSHTCARLALVMRVYARVRCALLTTIAAQV